MAESFGGHCNLRFDDTNPEKEEAEYAYAIEEDVRWLGYEWRNLCHASDYFDQLHGYAVDLIRNGHAYVDSQDSETIRETRGTLTEPGTDSPHRDRSASRKTWTCSPACGPANSPKDHTYCARASAWMPTTSTCAIRCCTASAASDTIAPAMLGRSTPCTTSPTACPIRWKVSPIPCVRLNSRITACFTTGSSTIWTYPAIRSRSNSPACRWNTRWSASACCSAWSRMDMWTAGTTRDCRPCAASAAGAIPPNRSGISATPSASPRKTAAFPWACWKTASGTS